jgi:hypothetical protein
LECGDAIKKGEMAIMECRRARIRNAEVVVVVQKPKVYCCKCKSI